MLNCWICGVDVSDLLLHLEIAKTGLPRKLIKAREVKMQQGRNTRNMLLRFLKTQSDFVTGKDIEAGANLTRGRVLASMKVLIPQKKVIKQLRPNFKTGKIDAYYKLAKD